MAFEFKGVDTYERKNWGDVFTVLGFSLEHDVQLELCEPLYEPSYIRRMAQEDPELARDYVSTMSRLESPRLKAFAAEQAVDLIPTDAEFALPLVMSGLGRAEANGEHGLAHYLYDRLTENPEDFDRLPLHQLADLIRAVHAARTQDT